jgi:hypothetical protein
LFIIQIETEKSHPDGAIPSQFELPKEMVELDTWQKLVSKNYGK